MEASLIISGVPKQYQVKYLGLLVWARYDILPNCWSWVEVVGGLALHNLNINVASQVSQLVSLGLYVSNRETVFSGEQFQTI